MLYVKFKDKKALAVVQESAMREAIPASLPLNPSVEDLRPFGFAPLPPSVLPVGLVETDTLRYGYVAKLGADGNWFREVILEPVEQTEIYSRKQRKIKEVLNKRNALLAESDWTQLPDVPALKQSDWATYREALRNLPQSLGFPWSMEWPIKPE